MEKEVKTGRPAVAPEANPGDGVRQDNFQGFIYFFIYSGPLGGGGGGGGGNSNIVSGGKNGYWKKI